MMQRLSPTWVTSSMVVVALGLSACTDKAKNSERAASERIDALAKRVEGSVAELERALPEGAAKSFEIFYQEGDPRDDLQKVQRGLSRVQQRNAELTTGKATFFALFDADGVAIRNNLETDWMGGRDMFALFPGLAAARTQAFASAVGSLAAAKNESEAEPTWIAVSPIRQEGALKGFLASGWSFRWFSYYLQEELRTAEREKLGDQSETKLPIFYVAVFDAKGVYSAPQTPQGNEEALRTLSLPDRTREGQASGVLEIEGRAFGWSALRTPRWGESLGVVLLCSEV